MQGRHSGSEMGKETSHHQFTFSSWKSFAVAGAHVLVGSHTAFWGVLGSWACPLALVYLSMKAQRFPFLPIVYLWEKTTFLLNIHMHKHINVVTEEIIAEVSKSCMQSFSVMTTELRNICELRNLMEDLLYSELSRLGGTGICRSSLNPE